MQTKASLTVCRAGLIVLGRMLKDVCGSYRVSFEFLDRELHWMQENNNKINLYNSFAG